MQDSVLLSIDLKVDDDTGLSEPVAVGRASSQLISHWFGPLSNIQAFLMELTDKKHEVLCDELYLQPIQEIYSRFTKILIFYLYVI